MANDGSGKFGTVNRRGFIGSCGAITGVGLAAGGIATGASAALGGNIRTFKGKYAVDGHRIIDGLFASPRGRANLDVVVVVPAEGTSKSAAEAEAHSYAARGYLAIAPDLAATYPGALGRESALAALQRDLPRLSKLALGSGRVAVAA